MPAAPAAQETCTERIPDVANLEGRRLAEAPSTSSSLDLMLGSCVFGVWYKGCGPRLNGEHTVPTGMSSVSAASPELLPWERDKSWTTSAIVARR